MFRDEKNKRRFTQHIRQYVALTGLNLEEFNRTIDGLRKIHKYFEDKLPKFKIEPIHPLTNRSNVALACYTRYFKESRYCRTTVACPFGPGVDPNGDLDRLAHDNFIHTEDNSVQYLKKQVDVDGSVKYVSFQITRQLIDSLLSIADISTFIQFFFKWGILSKLLSHSAVFALHQVI